jgi:NAD+ diphosphatase
VSERFEPAVSHPERPSATAWWFAFRGSELLVEENGALASIPCLPDPAAAGPRHYLGRCGELDCWALGLEEGAAAPPGSGFRGLRSLYGVLSDDHWALAGRAFQVVEWERTHRFCGRCGNETEDAAPERARRCAACGHLAFPRLSPAVIVLVRRGREMLLARGRAFAGPFYSVLAGFVDPGESLEEAVAREIREEVGIEVTAIRYFGSQSWPFPHSLMIGFTAEYAGGEITVDEAEIVDAGWFTAERLPQLPGKLSIARALVDAFLGESG